MNLSICSQTRAFQDDATYLPQPYPVDRRYPVPAPGYDSYVNTGYPGVRTIQTAFGPINYADSEVQPTNPNNEPIDEVANRLLPPMVFVNGKPVYTPEPESNQPEFVPAGQLQHLTRIPESGSYQKLPQAPPFDICLDYFRHGIVTQQAERVEKSIWGSGDDFVLRRPMPSILVNGRPLSGSPDPTVYSQTATLLTLAGIGLFYMFNRT
jgi:hypothetical protein